MKNDARQQLPPDDEIVSDITSETLAQASGEPPAPKVVKLAPGQWYAIEQSNGGPYQFNESTCALIEECYKPDGVQVRRVRARFNGEYIELPPDYDGVILAGEFIARDVADPHFPDQNPFDHRVLFGRDDEIARAATVKAKLDRRTEASIGMMRDKMGRAEHILTGMIIQERARIEREHRQLIQDNEDLAFYQQWLRGKAVYERRQAEAEKPA